MTESSDLWERYAAVVDRRVHRGRRPGVRRADPAAGRRASWPVRPRVLDVGCGDGQVARLAAGAGRRRPSPSASTRRGTRSRSPPSGGRDRRSSRAGADGLPFADASFDAVVACLVFEHIDDVDEAIAEVARVLAPGGRFCFFLNHPLLQTPEQRLDRRPGPRPARAVLAHRPVPARGRDDRGGREGRLHPLHPPAAVALRQRARRPRPAARADGRAGAAARLPGAGRRSTPTRPPSPGCCTSVPAQALATG